MTVALVAAYREKMLAELLADDVIVVGVDAGYVYDPTDDFLDDVAASVVITSALLTGKSGTDGYFNADTIDFGTPAAGDNVRGYFLVRDTGVAGTSDLVMFWDEDATGEPVNKNTTGLAYTVELQDLGLFRL